ncbi:pyruvate ferredoxin oxidoreductase, alpha subunit [Archaeoglobus sulfaticallidus PM70-1]|uniref:Pyruvate ferredoxin oxidoreductase, alpha subunit n=1 Tax=Archaeoglobus sulfaticallidus PM70-1 TaxID=387631 RepID=N0B9T3_9EURY|nr:transketolase C-terminal domain-containing protein [Archaeoglobus sulfaticallidus]AGK60354.1 pyruvate ferredoxin oxidoreductase, alpha subunit [Archaeoglobus sulfaticallidus PM70-1]
MKKVVRGFYSIAHAVKLCKPNVIAAYPITPQTEIVENLAKMYSNGELEGCEYVTAESEFGAASILVGASAAGARTFTATCSQGLILMSEVLLNAAGMRLPIVLVNTNRALSAPLSIWNDHQDSMVLRDGGLIQIHVETNQEAHDMVPLAFKVAENSKVMLPFMINMDGFKLTHAYEPVDLLDQDTVDSFLPPYNPPVYMTTKNPLTFGCYAPPHCYTEFRVVMQRAMMRALDVLEETYREWAEVTGRDWGGHVVGEFLDDAELAIVSMGSLTGMVRDVVKELRKNGVKVGLLKIRTFRPFPAKQVKEALKNANKILVFERAVSFGYEGPVGIEVKSALFGLNPEFYSFAVGLGGRDVPREELMKIITDVYEGKVEQGFHFGTVKEFEEVIV